jgi:hypothetical protein
MLGAMAAVPLPNLAPTAAAAERLQASLYDDDHIEVPVYPFPVPAALAAGEGPASVIVRVSAQAYNRPDEYEFLGERLAARLRAPSSPRSLLGRLRRN